MPEVVCEQHKSPDGELELIVLYADGDIVVGFPGFPWHTHPTVIAGEYGFDVSVAVRRFVDAIVQDRLLIVVQKKKGKAVDVWVTERPPPPDRWAEPDEERVLRYWSKPFEEPAEGKAR